MELNAAQNVFLNGLDTKFRAYVGGFGCVHPDTKVWTEHGLMRIADISSPVRVLSWNEKDHRFQLSLSGGSFPKGRANLYRVLTPNGEFVSSGHHRIFSSDCKYAKVEDLCEGDGVATCAADLLRSNSGRDLLLLPSDVRNWTKKDEDLMGRYAFEGRLHGQQFLRQKDSGQSFSPSASDAHKLGQSCDQAEVSARLGGLSGLKQLHSRLCRFFGLQQTNHSAIQLPSLGSVAEASTSSLCAEYTSQNRRSSPLSALMFSRHRIGKLFSFVCQSFGIASQALEFTTVLKVTEEEESVYYDMQVMDTNNYVCENGFIHHNSGKTFTGCLDQLIFFAKHPGTVQGYFGPSYPSIRDIFYPTMDEAASMMGFRTVVRESNKEVHFYRGRKYYGTTICRSMDRPETIVGFKIARGLADEIDTLKADKADKVWNKMIARLRLKIDGVENGLGITTTPEGFKFTYNKFKRDPTESYSMVQASTYENEKYLPPDYISSLRESYPSNLIDAYINGDFVNLEGGTVYRLFDRHKNNTDITETPNDVLYIGMDFNVGKMSAVIHIEREGRPVAVDEIFGMLDTKEMIFEINRRYSGRQIRVYPDSSGKNRKSANASETDISQLKAEGYSVYYKSTNPAVRDRINAMNSMFCNGDGERRYLININRCPRYTDDLEQQVYNKQGEPDKAHDHDHMNDAGGYYIAYEFPIIKPIVRAGFRQRL